jgi:hypothetical protein
MHPIDPGADLTPLTFVKDRWIDQVDPFTIDCRQSPVISVIAFVFFL